MKIATHILLLKLMLVFPANSQTWLPTSAPVTNWQAVAMTADGSKLAAVVNGGSVYVSTNSGVTWEASAVTNSSWHTVACSADGGLLVVAGGPIYVSTNWGATWVTSNTPTTLYIPSVAVSADGTKLTAVQYCPGYTCESAIYTSTNCGATWVQTAAPAYTPWRAVACSAEGRQILAVERGEYIAGAGRIWISLDYGSTWAPSYMPYHPWSSICSTADGRIAVAAASDGICISTNSGGDWIFAGDFSWYNSVAASAVGSTLITVVSYTSLIYTSTNSGLMWQPSGFASNDFSFVASSADGNMLVAAGGGIYISKSTPAPVIDVKLSSNNVLLSWTVPSKKFVLQQKQSLVSSEWMDVDVIPVLNYTNLHYQLTFAPVGRMFYRLAAD